LGKEKASPGARSPQEKTLRAEKGKSTEGVFSGGSGGEAGTRKEKYGETAAWNRKSVQAKKKGKSNLTGDRRWRIKKITRAQSIKWANRRREWLAKTAEKQEWVFRPGASRGSSNKDPRQKPKKSPLYLSQKKKKRAVLV